MRTNVRRRLIRAVATRAAATTALLAATLFAGTATASPGWAAEVTYSARYWELLDRYASVEATWAPIRGVYYGDPEKLLTPPEQKEPGGTVDMFHVVILNPDGTLGATGWVADPAAPNGWRELAWSDCEATLSDDNPTDPTWWQCFNLYYA